MNFFQKIVLCLSALALMISCSSENVSSGSAKNVEHLKWLSWTQEELEESKKNIKVDGHIAQQAYDKLIADAEKSMTAGPFTVMSKSSMPESGDKHDYLTLSTYWWPNPNTDDGLPYIRLDGQTNPETQDDSTDKRTWGACYGAIYNLVLAHYFSGEDKYAEKAVELTKVWFLNEDTKMNPNMKYGQSVRGVSPGRVYGLIEVRHFIKVIDCMLLLEHVNSPHWTPADMAALRTWFVDFLDWCYSDDTGLGEMWGYNNHAVWMDAQMIAYLMFTGQFDRARDEITLSIRRERSHFSADGHQHEEAARTRAFSYHCFALEAWAHIIRYGQKLDYPMHYRNLLITRSRNIRDGVKYLLPYIMREKEWPFYEIRGFDREFYRGMIFLPMIRDAFHPDNVKANIRPTDPDVVSIEDPEVEPITGYETLGVTRIDEVTEALMKQFPTNKEVLLFPVI